MLDNMTICTNGMAETSCETTVNFDDQSPNNLQLNLIPIELEVEDFEMEQIAKAWQKVQQNVFRTSVSLPMQ